MIGFAGIAPVIALSAAQKRSPQPHAKPAYAPKRNILEMCLRSDDRRATTSRIPADRNASATDKMFARFVHPKAETSVYTSHPKTTKTYQYVFGRVVAIETSNNRFMIW
jgi:hypothetical protein